MARVKLEEMSIKLELSQNKAYAAAEDHREALMTLRDQNNEIALNNVQLKCDVNATQAERDSLLQ